MPASLIIALPHLLAVHVAIVASFMPAVFLLFDRTNGSLFGYKLSHTIQFMLFATH